MATDDLQHRHRRHQLYVATVLLAVGSVGFFAVAGIVSLTPVTWNHALGAVIALILIAVIER